MWGAINEMRALLFLLELTVRLKWIVPIWQLSGPGQARRFVQRTGMRTRFSVGGVDIVKDGNRKRCMNKLGNLAVVGSGPTAVFLLKHILDAADTLRGNLTSLTVLEKGAAPGYGMPYHPDTTDIHNFSNISSEEIPELLESLIGWLRAQPAGDLDMWQMDRETLSASEVYPRIAVGAYLKAQFDGLMAQLEGEGIVTRLLTQHCVSDIRKEQNDKLTLHIGEKEPLQFDSVVIATGHAWPLQDDVAHCHFLSPWPIRKLLPGPGTFINTTVGILGASLSAFDVVSSLAHRHGKFVTTDMGLKYEALPGTDSFKLVMHSLGGWLPHLQFDHDEPLREIYRHVDRAGMLGLVNEGGFLRLADYFDRVCRPALSTAFGKDENVELVELLSHKGFGLVEFVEKMTEDHRYSNAFEGMAAEMVEARTPVLHHKSLHWKQTIDDLIYTLNFHAELMPAEDHLTFRKVVSPFLMNVIAAMPLSSAGILLALHQAGVLQLEKGEVTVDGQQLEPGSTSVTITNEGVTSQERYGMFVECGGQKALGLEDYPFRSLVDDGIVCDATAIFIDPEAIAVAPPGKIAGRAGEKVLLTGGVAVDSAYRVLRADGTADSAIYDLAFPHTSGTRPYSYGLQACSVTSRITVGAWVQAIINAAPVEGSLENVTVLYESDQKRGLDH